MTSELFIQVAVSSPLRQLFDYRLPDSPEQAVPKPGVRVLVPFGNRRLVGIVTGASSTTTFPEERIRRIEKVLDAEPVLDEKLLALYQWAADYYQFPLGQALQTSLPKEIRQGQPAREKQPVAWQLTATGKMLDPATLKRAPRQQQALAALAAMGHMTVSALREQLATEIGACLKSLQEKGLVEQAPDQPTPPADPAGKPLHREAPPHILNPQQEEAVAAIRAAGKNFQAFLLDGVTGSGKTEIYLQAIADILAAGKQVLVMVPEISLTPQTVRRFAGRFNREVVAFHSGLSDSQRLGAWLRAASGEAAIVIGTRSAIFTPLAKPGLVIVDEEHDASYKQQDGFRYSGRDLAIYRARQLGVPVILGSATPSLESLHNALAGRYTYLALTERAGAASQPDYRLLDLKGQDMTDGFSAPLLDMIRSHLAQHSQVLVFLNRRGFAPILLCRDCGWIATCPRCDSSYTLHRQPPRLICHHCEAQKPVAHQCPECGGADLAAMGQGTEKTEATLSALFPDTPVYRIDRDSTRNRGSLPAIIDKVDSGEPCILVGTQMLSKGHHFPSVTLVAVLDADSGLFSADFRGQEHMGQLLVQVAGRAGRGENRGEVVIQTYNSTHPTLQSLVRDGYGPFARQLLEERRLGRLPPFSYMALLRAEAANRALPERFLAAAREAIREQGGLTVIGPMPSPMEKRSGLFRVQLVIEAGRRSTVQACLHTLLPVLETLPDSRKVRWSVDVDPLDFT